MARHKITFTAVTTGSTTSTTPKANCTFAIDGRTWYKRNPTPPPTDIVDNTGQIKVKLRRGVHRIAVTDTATGNEKERIIDVNQNTKRDQIIPID